VPFQDILRELVSSVEGAGGAIFLDADGEAVQWFAKSDAERLKLRAAYTAVMVQSCRAAARSLKLGRMNYLMIDYDGARLLAQEIESGYFIVLELDASSTVGQALYRLEPAVARLRREVAS
jgi:predicted regulator of Ras-like GTPase activity (Roadblock/LC7/MglB family)